MPGGGIHCRLRAGIGLVGRCGRGRAGLGGRMLTSRGLLERRVVRGDRSGGVRGRRCLLDGCGSGELLICVEVGE